MNEGAVFVIIVVVLLILPCIFRPLLGAIYAGLIWLSFATFALLDELCSASLLPHCPWVMYLLWGALIGASLGFWTVAPVFGMRKHRSLIGIAPLILMAIVGLLRLACHH